MIIVKDCRFYEKETRRARSKRNECEYSNKCEDYTPKEETIQGASLGMAIPVFSRKVIDILALSQTQSLNNST